jgi:hypothetical protein
LFISNDGKDGKLILTFFVQEYTFFVCHAEISQIIALLVAILVMLESPQ